MERSDVLIARNGGGELGSSQAGEVGVVGERVLEKKSGTGKGGEGADGKRPRKKNVKMGRGGGQKAM